MKNQIKTIIFSTYTTVTAILFLGLIYLNNYITVDARITAGCLLISTHYLIIYIKLKIELDNEKLKEVKKDENDAIGLLHIARLNCNHEFPYRFTDCNCNKCGADSKIYRTKEEGE